jgi:predicted flap endonuclease-1-like 5' DNA nuclease
MHKAVRLTIFLPLIGALLAGCEQLGLENPAQIAAAREAEGRAVGSACRHSGRALEDCFFLNPRAQKSAIFTGWRDMDSYMRENNLEIIDPVISRPDDVSRKNKAAPVEMAPAEKTMPAETAPTNKEGAKRSAVELPSPATAPAKPGGGKMA